MTLNELRESCRNSNNHKRANHINDFNFEDLEFNEGVEEIMSTTNHCNHQQQQPCPQLPGTLLRIFIPAGATINLLNLIELTSPSGICLIIRSPLLAGAAGGTDLAGIANSIRQAGGTVEFMNR